MNIDWYRFTYLFADFLIMLPVWLFIFLKRKDLRKEIFIVSLVTGILGPISEFYYFKDYWQPQFFYSPIRFEDFFFGFFVGGIAASVYDVLFDRHFSKKRNKHIKWLWFIIPFFLILFVILEFFIFRVRLNSIYASIIAFCVITFFIIILRRDLIFVSLASGLVMGLCMFFGYLILILVFPELFERWWTINNLSKVFVLGIPIEELFWGVGWGMVCGPIYEFFGGLKFKGGNDLHKFEEKFNEIS